MKWPALIRRHEIWVPTFMGCAVLLLLGSAAGLMVLRCVHPFLALNKPVGAPLLIVEGWMDSAGLDQAVLAFRSGGYERVVTTGAPIEWPEPHGNATYAERAANYLKQHGLAEAVVTAVPTPKSAQDHTFLSAVTVREWAKQSGLTFNALDIFSSGTHARRSRQLYQMAFGPTVKVGVIAARSSDYDADRWWRTSIGARDVLEQAIGLFWVKCFFWPSPPGSPEERWEH